MNNIKTKIIALILVIPLLLVFTTGSVAGSVDLFVDIPVESITILGEDQLNIDLAENSQKVQIKTQILPENATNQGVTFSAEQIQGQPLAEVKISSDGVVTPLSIGSVKIIAYAEGKSDSVIINYSSSMPVELQQVVNRINLKLGDTVTIAQNQHYKIEPENLQPKITWESANTQIATVSNGTVWGLAAGITQIKAKFECLTIDSNGQIGQKVQEISFDINVSVDLPQTGITFGGQKDGLFPLYTTNKNLPQEFTFQYDSQKVDLSKIELSYDEEVFSLVSIEGANTKQIANATIKAAFSENAVHGQSYRVILLQNGNQLATVDFVYAVMTKAEIVAQSTDILLTKYNGSSPDFTVKTDAVEMYGFDYQTEKKALQYEVMYTSSDSSILSVNSFNNKCMPTPLKEGVVTITAHITDCFTKKLVLTCEKVFTVHNPYTLLSFKENADLGLEREFAFGKFSPTKSNDKITLSPNDYSLPINVSTIKGQVEEDKIDYSRLLFTSSNEQIAKIDQTGKITLQNQSGRVTFTLSYQGYGSNASAQITINFRQNGVNVSNYEELMWTTNNGYEVVLQADIMLAPKIGEAEPGSNFPYKDYANSCLTEIDPTCDTTFYDNQNQQPKIKYAVEFTANVFGNGHYINADNLTRQLPLKANVRVYNGPIDLVRWGNQTESIAVKSQDNIIFYVKKDNITLTNVELKGCSDSSLLEDGKFNLGLLDYCGTVLEIAGDNCMVSYSRINNGRTVVRAFGKKNDSLNNVKANPNGYKADITIKNCELGYAREFILKMGTNQINRVSESDYSDFGITYLNQVSQIPAKQVFDEASPHFLDQSGNKYTLDRNQNAQDSYFNENYVLTDVTVWDCVFRNAGLFSIGLESMFGGLCLHRYDYSDTYAFCSKLGWKGVSGASYPASLHLKGDVRFYDWKALSSLNSDTLLEGGDTQVAQLIGFQLDFGKLIKNYDEQNEGVKLLAIDNGVEHVNGAIAFYGGGKNYSYVDVSQTSPNFNELYSYSVPVKNFIEQGKERFVMYTAGVEDFNFLLYNSQSRLSVKAQEKDFQSGQALSWLYKNN